MLSHAGTSLLSHWMQSFKVPEFLCHLYHRYPLQSLKVLRDQSSLPPQTHSCSLFWSREAMLNHVGPAVISEESRRSASAVASLPNAACMKSLAQGLGEDKYQSDISLWRLLLIPPNPYCSLRDSTTEGIGPKTGKSSKSAISKVLLSLGGTSHDW